MATRNPLVPEIWRGERGALSPLREINRLQRRIDRVFDEFFREPALPSLFAPLWGEETAIPEVFCPPCDVEETDSHFLVSFDLPGLKKDEIKIDVRGNQLTVSGERKGETKGRASRERVYGAFMRSFTLPSNIDPDKVEAQFENGVLQLSLPKTEVTPAKRIPIREGKAIGAKPEKAA